MGGLLATSKALVAIHMFFSNGLDCLPMLFDGHSDDHSVLAASGRSRAAQS